MQLGQKRIEEMTFPIRNSGQMLVIAPKVLRVFRKHIQDKSDAPEGGGVLLAKFSLPQIEIVSASEPKLGDIRQRYLFASDQKRRKRLVSNAFRKGLHFVGEWHTHPQHPPSPSILDVESMSDLFLQSVHELNCFVMVIVGDATDGLSLWVSLHDGKEVHRLHPLRTG